MENIVLDILLPKSKPITVGIIYRPQNPLGKLRLQPNEIYLLGDFNSILFFEGHYVLQKYSKRL